MRTIHVRQEWAIKQSHSSTLTRGRHETSPSPYYQIGFAYDSLLIVNIVPDMPLCTYQEAESARRVYSRNNKSFVQSAQSAETSTVEATHSSAHSHNMALADVSRYEGIIPSIAKRYSGKHHDPQRSCVNGLILPPAMRAYQYKMRSTSSRTFPYKYS